MATEREAEKTQRQGELPLAPKTLQLWLEMVALEKALHKVMPEIPAEQWYQFYYYGKEESSAEWRGRISKVLEKQRKKIGVMMFHYDEKGLYDDIIKTSTKAECELLGGKK
jgi:hypothetical protein